MVKIVTTLFLLTTIFYCVQSRDNNKLIHDIIRDHEIVIFSLSFCQPCASVKNIFRDLNMKFFEFVIDHQGEDSFEILDILSLLTGRTSVPQVFINKKFVGGYKEIQEMYENGTLVNFCDCLDCECSMETY
ncbi:unnamed protein product [Hermetia illucens]|uniref:Glutaredoxin domain-containing protein n=1 Tax=Hermetia illucens TaxID=343691 RepID=A0A7R8YPZ7_HERIL|nr:glutaredoxin-C8-like [Hermetia illucens]CAD7081153.1 unnamed protein product [Hermetia illucens]